MKPLVLWLPSQNGFVPDWPQRHNETPFGFSRIVPSARITVHGPETFTGPLVITFTLRASVELASIDNILGGGSDFSEIAPVGQA